jgi:cytochrome oxidase Cu insertion factor (SCO1/SenC/PrrC family)
MKFSQAVKTMNSEGKVLLIVLIALISSMGFVALNNSLAASSSTQKQDFDTLRLIEPKPSPKAPTFGLKNLEGKLLRSASLKGKPTMLYFWATW